MIFRILKLLKTLRFFYLNAQDFLTLILCPFLLLLLYMACFYMIYSFLFTFRVIQSLFYGVRFLAVLKTVRLALNALFYVVLTCDVVILVFPFFFIQIFSILIFRHSVLNLEMNQQCKTEAFSLINISTKGPCQDTSIHPIAILIDNSQSSRSEK